MARTPYLPTPQGLNAEFYAKALGGTLHLQRCAECARFSHPPRYRCHSCSSERFEWVPSAGRGELYSWTVSHVAFDRGWAEELPYATGIIELEEGVRIVGALEGIDRSHLKIGMKLRTRLTPLSEAFVFITLVTAESA